MKQKLFFLMFFFLSILGVKAQSLCEAPVNFQSNLHSPTWNNVQLTWGDPIDDSWQSIEWCTTVRAANIGLNANGTFRGTVRFEVSDLTSYVGEYLHAVSFMPMETQEICTYYIEVYTGGSVANNTYTPGTLVMSQEVSSVITNTLNTVRLRQPVAIPANQELWISIKCVATSGYPLGCSDNTAVDGKGNIININEGAWSTLLSQTSPIPYNWIILGSIGTGTTSIVGFNLYKDDVALNTTPYLSNSYLDTLPLGIYQYEVTALYSDNCESDPTSITVVMNDNPCTNCSDSVIVGTGTSTVFSIPLNTYYNYSYSQQIYLASELGARNAEISCIAYQYIYSMSQDKDVKIYMGNTNLSSFSSAADMISAQDMQLVFDGTVTFSQTSNGWVNIPLSTPFEWDGVSNVVVAVLNNTGSYVSSNNHTFKCHEVPANSYKTLTLYRDGNPYNPEVENYSTSMSTSSMRNNMKFMFGNEILCNIPSQLMISGVTHESAVVSWNSNESAVGYEVVCVLPNEDVSQGTPISVTDTFCTIPNLNDNTVYTVYVRTNCGTSNSNYTFSNFRTNCLSIDQLPFVENFDTYGVGTSVYPFCWRKLTNYPSYPSISQTSSSVGALTLYSSSTHYTYAILPAFDTDVLDLNTLQMKFKALQTSASYGNLEVGIMTDITNPASFVTISSIAPTDYQSINVWQDFVVRFDSYTGENGNIAFRMPRSYTSYTHIDDVEVDLISGCGNPSHFEVVRTAGSSAYLTWRASEYADDLDLYNVEYSLRGSDIWQSINPVGTSCVLTGLQQSSFYDVILYVTCDNGHSDTLSLSFATSCLAGGDLAIGAGTTESSYTPSNTNYNYSLTQQLFLASEMNGPTLLRGVKFNITTSANQTRTWDIYLGTTTQSTLTPSTYVPVTGHTKVFSGVISTATAGWLEINFDTTFVYSGDNLVMTINDLTNSWSSPAYFQIHSSTNTTIGTFEDNASYNPAQPPTMNARSHRNNVIFIANCDSNVTCVSPTIYEANVTTSSISLVWAPGYQETSWELDYKSASDSVWISEGTINQTSYTISNLNDNTFYDVRLRAVCDAGEYSDYASIRVETACIPVSTLPFVENFDNVDVNSFPECWTRNYGVATSPYPYLTSEYSVTSGGKSMYMYAGSSTNYALAILPEFGDEILMDSLMIVFKMRAGNTAATIEVGIIEDPENNATFTSFASLNTVSTGVWEEKELYTRGYTGNGRHVAFRVPIGNNYSSWIDEISIVPIPTCTHVNDLTVSSVDSSSVTITWTPGGLEMEYEVILLPAGPVDLDTISSTNIIYTTTFTETDLLPSTNYSFYVRALCDASSASTWERIDVMTSQVPSYLPYECDFEAANPLWNFYNGTAANVWCIGSAVNNGGSKSMYITNDGGTTNSYTSNAPSIVWAYRDIYFPANSAGYTFSFDWRAQGESSFDFMNVFLGAVTEINSSNSSQYDQGLVGTVKLNSSRLNLQSTFQTFSMNLPGYETDGVRRLYFVWRNDGSIGYNPAAAIDNISIQEISCPIPSNVTANNITATTTDISWTENGTATSWIVYYKEANATQWQSDITTTTNYQFANLTPETTYSVKIAADCGNNQDFSPTSSVVVFTTLPSCPAPTNLVSNGNTNTTIDLSWTAGGSETSWIIAYKLYSDNWNNATEITSTATSYTLTGLTSDVYNIRVKAACTATDESQWSNEISIAPGSFYLPVTGTHNITTCNMTILDDGGVNGDYSISADVTLTINPENPGDVISLTGNYDLEDDWDFLYIYDGSSTAGTPMQTLTGVGVITATSTSGPLTIHFTSDAMICNSGFVIVASCASGGNTEPCNAPTNVMVNPAQTTANVNWTSNASAWVVEYKVATATNWTASAQLSTPNYNITGLNPATDYVVRVKSICENGNESVWSTEVPFTTLSADVTTYTITASASGPGTITPNGTVTVQEGDNATFTFAANANAVVAQVLVDAAAITTPADNSYTFSNVVANHTIEVVFEEEQTGINDMNMDAAVALFPNPATSEINIQMADNRFVGSTMQVYDVYGKLITTSEIVSQSVRLDVSAWANGVYIVRINSNESIVTKRFVKR